MKIICDYCTHGIEKDNLCYMGGLSKCNGELFVPKVQNPIRDIVGCIAIYDKDAPLEEKGKYLEVVQKSLRECLGAGDGESWYKKSEEECTEVFLIESVNVPISGDKIPESDNVFKNAKAIVKDHIDDPKIIEVVIPSSWRNCAVTLKNDFISDTNDSSFQETLKFPLPTPMYKWVIKCHKGDPDKPQKQIIELIDKPSKE